MSSLQVSPRNLGSDPSSKHGLQGPTAVGLFAIVIGFTAILCVCVMCKRNLGWRGPRQIDEMLYGINRFYGPSGRGNVPQGREVVEMDEVERPRMFECWVLDGNGKEKENKWVDIMVRLFVPLQQISYPLRPSSHSPHTSIPPHISSASPKLHQTPLVLRIQFQFQLPLPPRMHTDQWHYAITANPPATNPATKDSHYQPGYKLRYP
jgi:hypothetical protein